MSLKTLIEFLKENKHAPLKKKILKHNNNAVMAKKESYIAIKTQK